MHPSPRKRSSSFWQFSVRTLFILTTVVAVLVWLTLVLEEFMLFALMIAVPVVGLSGSILGVVYLRRGRRAFAMGYGIAMLQLVILLWIFLFDGWRRGSEEIFILLAVLGLLVPVGCGWLGAVFYRLGEADRASETEKATTPAATHEPPLVAPAPSASAPTSSAI